MSHSGVETNLNKATIINTGTQILYYAFVMRIAINSYEVVDLLATNLKTSLNLSRLRLWVTIIAMMPIKTGYTKLLRGFIAYGLITIAPASLM
jgi:hypothetical protein